MAAPLISDIVTLPPISLHLTDYLPPAPPAPPVIPSYKRLKAQAKQPLLVDWGSDPAPEYYPYLSAIYPHPFMGLALFIASRIHQMRSGKSYLAAHTSWKNTDPNTTRPYCSATPQSSEYAILLRPVSAKLRSRLLEEVSDHG